MALPRRALLAVDGVRLHDQRAPARRFVHRASFDAAQGLDRAPGLRAVRAALRGDRLSVDFVASSYALAEQSDSTVGLRYRWLIKGIYAAGLWLVVLGILSVMGRVIVFLFGGPAYARVELPIGHTELEV